MITKGNKEVCNFRKKWECIVWQSRKIKWESSNGKFRDMCDNPHMEKECKIHPEKNV